MGRLQVDRATARTADRQRRHVVDWWTARQGALPPAMQTAIAGRQRDIVDLLVRFRDHTGRRRAISGAAASINWRDPQAADKFVGRLASGICRAAAGDGATGRMRAGASPATNVDGGYTALRDEPGTRGGVRVHR